MDAETASKAHGAPEFRHIDDMDWEMGRFGNVTKFLFHPRPERPGEPNAGLLRYEAGASFPLHKHDFAQVWYVLDGEFRFGDKTYGPGTIAYMPDPHYELEMHTDTGGTILFVQFQGPETGGRPIYDGRMNLKEAPPLTAQDLER
jgi:quercetin dioxygenase-like cupin family protein